MLLVMLRDMQRGAFFHAERRNVRDRRRKKETGEEEKNSDLQKLLLDWLHIHAAHPNPRTSLILVAYGAALIFQLQC